MGTTSVTNALAARLQELRAALAALEARSARISMLRGLTLLVAIGLAAVRIFTPVPPIIWEICGALALTFVALVVAHAVLVTRMSALEIRVRVVERAQKRSAWDFAGLPERGDRFVDDRHAYIGDLDIFGPSSLFQLLSAAETGAGEAALARWLSAPADSIEIASRQEAARELASMTRYREDLAARGVESGTRGRDADSLVAWAEADSTAVPTFVLRLAPALVALTVGLFVAGEILASARMGPLRHAWALTLIAQVVLLLAIRPALERTLSIVSSPETPFGRYVELLRLIEGQPFSSPRLSAIRDELTRPLASGEIGKLQRIVSFAELRHNGQIYVLANFLLLWDVGCAAALDRWRARSGKQVRRWISAIAEMEALSSLGTFAWEHPDYAFPEVTPGELSFAADELGHPLIPVSRRVSNDLELESAGSALMITGSNMSGKSTLLRAVGINAVLALAGAPVCARRLLMKECVVRTSMRIKDSLEQGVSHFYAELERLKGIADVANGGGKVLFLLDEVLHGTNSRERRIGAKAVVRHLLAKGSIGAVSSHDLGLADLEADSGGRVRNVHFEELVAEGRMTFDYKLKPGVVTSANALRLMKVIGIDVELPDS